jgi:hypothetical protein
MATQAGTACTYGIGSTSGTVSYSGGSGSVGIAAPGVCHWTAVSSAPAWLQITSSGSAGNGNVSFAAAPWNGAASRSGVITVTGIETGASMTYTVTQGGAPCQYTLVPNASGTVASAGASNLTFAFSTEQTGCSNQAMSYANWVTVSTTWGSDGQSGYVTYSVAPNPSATNRSGTVQFGPQTFTVTQTGAPCAYSLSSYGLLFDKLGANGNTLLASQSAGGCPAPIHGTDQPFLTASPPTGPVSNIWTVLYSVAPFNRLTPATRKGKITIGGQIFSVKQTSW